MAEPQADALAAPQHLQRVLPTGGIAQKGMGDEGIVARLPTGHRSHVIRAVSAFREY